MYVGWSENCVPFKEVIQALLMLATYGMWSLFIDNKCIIEPRYVLRAATHGRRYRAAQNILDSIRHLAKCSLPRSLMEV